MAAKTTSKTPRAKPRNRVKASAVTQRPTYAELRQQLDESLWREKATREELQNALEQQSATSEILSAIASSATQIQPVLDAVAATAARLCEATDAQIRLIEGERTRLVASFGIIPAPEFMPTSVKTPYMRAIT